MNLALPEVRVRRFASKGVEIVADEAGPRDGVPVVLMHGGGQTRAAWGAAVLEAARRGYHVISADLRGHGDSGWHEQGAYSLEDHASDLGAIAETLGKAPFVVGASLGGLASLAYAASGAPLRGLVLVDVAPRIEAAGAEKIGGFMRSAPNGFASLEEAADAVSAYLPHRPRPKDTSGLMKNLRLKDGRYHWHWDPRMLNGRGPVESERLREAARNLKVPALLIRGQLSEVLSEEGVKDFLSLVPHAEFADIADADHMVAGDRNDAFNQAAFDFLERHR